MHPGSIEFAGGQTHDFSKKSSFDREAQQPMMSMPSIQKWCIVFQKRDGDVRDTVVRELHSAIERSKWKGLNQPNLVDVQDNRPNSWTTAIRSMAEAEFILLLIPGNRGKDDNNL